MAKRFSTKDYILYIAVRIGSFAVSMLPLHAAMWIGKIVGFSMRTFHSKRKRIAYANLKAAFSKEKSPRELLRIVKKVYSNFGRTVMEIMRLPRVNHEYLKKYVIIERFEHFHKARERGKGVIYLTSHFDNWEYSGLKSAQTGYPIHILVRPQKPEVINNLLNRYREKLGCKMIARGMSAREIIKALKGNKVVAILSDQDTGKSGIYMNFLGRPASQAIGAVRLARDTGAAIVPNFIIRTNGPNHRVKVEKPIIIPKTDNRDADIKEGITRCTRLLESYIRQYPDQWMWGYTRWKSTPLRKVVILSDGRAGHINQSKAAFETIRRCRKDAGFKDKDTKLQIIDVKFKSRLKRTMLSICALFATDRCQGCMKCLKFSLKKDSYQALMSSYADIVISCGSSLAGVNVFMTKENNAKNVTLMKPGIIPIKNFNVAIIPSHDRPREMDNVVITEGSPSIINEDSKRDGSQRIQKKASLGNKKRLGVLLGGDTPAHKFIPELADKLISQIEESLEKLDMELLVTTSRRTPKNVEELLKKRLEGNSRCKLLVVANEENIENAVSGILDLSDIVIVSGESISMVSEAASSGKKTIVFDLKTKAASQKHERAIKGLAADDYIRHIPIDRIGRAVWDISGDKAAQKRLDNAQKMYYKLYRII